MTLNKARRIAKRLMKEGLNVIIRNDRDACLSHNPTLHPMAGTYVVVNVVGAHGASAQLHWE